MFRKLLSLEEARQIILEQFKPKPSGVEEITLLESCDRVLAQDVTAQIDIPPFDRSTVDGYAVRAKDTFGAEENRPVTLRVSETVQIGELPRITVKKREAVEIVTGAPVPRGADAVIMIERTDRKANTVQVYGAVPKNENMMKAGVDIKKGETVLKLGKLLGSREVGALAALGMARVKVYRVPEVAVLSTGPELTEPGRRLPPGKIYDINAYSISTAVRESGGKPVYLGVFPDRLTELTRGLKHAIGCANIVVTSGGVSVGPKDIMPKAVNSIGKPGVLISGIAMKPGKPTTVGMVHEKLVFSLPGHPTSALLVFRLLVGPMIRQMAGRPPEEDSVVRAIAATRMFSAKGRKTFVMVRLKREKSKRIMAEPVSGGDSGAIMTLASADGFVEIPQDTQFVDAGEQVQVHILGTINK